MSPLPTRVIHLNTDVTTKHRFSPTWCKRSGRGLVDESYMLLSTSNECNGDSESSNSSPSNHDVIEYPKLDRFQGVHQRTGSNASAFNFASVVDTNENYLSVNDNPTIHHPAAWWLPQCNLTKKSTMSFLFPRYLLFCVYINRPCGPSSLFYLCFRNVLTPTTTIFFIFSFHIQKFFPYPHGLG